MNKKQASHTKIASAGSLRAVPEIGLVDTSDPGVAERLAGKVGEQLEAFAPAAWRPVLIRSH
ncbi:MAG: hypothetical protein ACRD2C_05120 [Acidimicrobiales bacterium]